MIPFISWPDGSPCIPANAYMIKLRLQSGRRGAGPSRTGSKGGTFGQYAGEISHLIRFCFYNKINFTELCDDDFCQFIDGLRKETKINKPAQLRRNERTINSIGKRCLDFLIQVGEINGLPKLVAPNGNISTTTVNAVHYRNGKAYKRTSIHHRSLRTASAKKTRRPIAEATIERLRNAIDEFSTSDFLCNRRHLMISLFEEMGARRAEIQSITIDQIIAASKVKKPIITINTLKQGRTGITRELELSAPLIDELLNYIRGDRRAIVKRCRIIPDHGFLFITERGGRPLGIDTITTEFSKIRHAAGIEEQACAHLFRHAFCTNIVTRLISETQALSPDSFRQTMMTNKMLAEHAMAKSGHSSLESLLDYVDSAFRAKSKYQLIIHNVEIAQKYENYEKRKKRLRHDFKIGKFTKQQFIERDEQLDAAMDRDLLGRPDSENT